MTDEQRALFESWIVRSQESLKLGQTQVARVQLEAALQALYALPAVEKEASGDNAGLDLTRSEFERACSLLPPDFFWGLPVTPRLVLDIALAASPTVCDSAGEPVAEIVPCYTPSGKRVALNTEYQHLPIGTKLYAHRENKP